MFFQFRPNSPDLCEPSGNKLPGLLGSLIITAAICSVAGAAIAADGDDNDQEGSYLSVDVGGGILSSDQFESFSEPPAPPSAEGQKGDELKTPDSNGENGENGETASTTSLLGVGVSEMMPTEFYIESEQYGTGQYRRYIGYVELENGVKKRSGKLVQEILVTRDDADAIEKLPKLKVGIIPDGLQLTGFVAVKMWLSVVLTTYDGCLKKPKRTNDTWEWAKVDYEHESSRNDCALSFRLTVDTNAPGKMSAHKTKVFLTGELCRYPEGNTQFSSKRDDAECVKMPTVTVSKKERLFLSEADEKLRAVRSVLIAQTSKSKGFASYLQTLNPWGTEDKTPDLGDSIDLFSKFIGQLSSMSDTAYNWQLNPEYLGELEGATFHEVITGVRYNDTRLTAFLKPFGNGGFTADSKANLQSAGIESTISEMRVVDEDSEEDKDKVAYVFKLESKKGMSFEHEESGELIQLLDNSELSPMGRKNIQLREVQAKLNRCQAQRIDAEMRCQHLVDEKELLVTQLENERQKFVNTKALLDEKVEGLQERITLLERQLNLNRSAEEMDAVKEEQNKNSINMTNLKNEYDSALNELMRSHNLTISDIKADYHGRINRIATELTNARKEAKKSEVNTDSLEKSERELQAKVTKLEKELKDSEDMLNDRVKGASESYRKKIKELKKEKDELQKESEEKGRLLLQAQNDKQRALREERLIYAADLEKLKGSYAGELAKIDILLNKYFQERGVFSSLERKTYIMPTFDVVDDADGRPKTAFTRFSEREE